MGERREISLPADPVEPPDWADEQTWAVLRHDEPRTSAFWKVTLSCGRVTEAVCDLDWKPADGARCVSAQRLQEMVTEFEEFCEEDPDGMDARERDHMKRMLAEGWPRPEPEHICNTCSWARPIVAYQPIGWLVPRKLPPRPRKPPSREGLEQRLQLAEAEANRLREQLSQLDGPSDQEDAAD